MCFSPLVVTESGNSAIPFFLESVTFLTSIKVFFLFFDIKKSNLVSFPNLTIVGWLHNFLIYLVSYSLKTLIQSY